MNEEGGLLLIHRNTPKRVQWEIPGGKVEEQEKPAETCEREIEEELGIDVEVIREIGSADFQEDGYVMGYVWFECKLLSGEPKAMEGTHDDVKYFKKDELDEIKDELSPNTINYLEYNE